MKHDSAILKDIKGYFMRRRSAREAHAFERRMEADPFLYMAVQGFEDMLTSDIQQSMDELDDLLDKRVDQRISAGFKRGAMIAAGVVGLVVIIFGVSMLSSGEKIEAVNVAEQNYAPRNDQADFSPMDSYEARFKEREAAKLAEEQVSENIEPAKTATTSTKDETKPTAKKVEEPSKPKNSETMLAGGDQDSNNAKGGTEELKLEKAKATNSEEKTKPSEVTAQPAIEDEKVAKTAPQGGFGSYQQYLKKNIRRSSGMPSGSVIVSFEFDRDGKPKKLSVDKSLCTTCDLEAIRLIENGPAWNATDRKQRQSVAVDF